MEFEPMLTPREKFPPPEISPEEDWTCDAVDSEPKHYQRVIPAPNCNPTQKEDVQLEVLQHHIKLHPEAATAVISPAEFRQRRTGCPQYCGLSSWLLLKVQGKSTLPRKRRQAGGDGEPTLNNNNNNNNKERISRAPFHVKHAQLRSTGTNTKT